MSERQRGSSAGLLTEIALYAVSALISFSLLNNLFKKLDPTNSEANAKQAAEKKKELSARLGRGVLLNTNQYEDLIACDVINPAHMSVTFDSIGGLENIKQALHDLVILPLVRPELFQRGKLLSPTKGVLLYGPPGTGKTMIAKALAKESGACFLNVRSAALQSKWFGDAQKLVTAVFTLAWKIQPCVIFIDEIDSFLGTRKSNEHEAVTSMKTEFMALWDGFLTDNNARVLVLAATNRPWDIDEAILRRLPRAFEVPLPDAQQRQRILSVLLRGEDVDETLWADRDGALEQLAKASEGYSGSDLQDLCKQAAMLPIHDLLEEERLERAQAGEGALLPQREPRALSAEDLFAVLESAPPPSAEAAAAYHRSVMLNQSLRSAGPPRRASAPPGGPPPGGGEDGVDLSALLAALMSSMSQAAAPAAGAAANGSAATPAAAGPRLPPRGPGRDAGRPPSWHDAPEA